MLYLCFATATYQQHSLHQIQNLQIEQLLLILYRLQRLQGLEMGSTLPNSRHLQSLPPSV